MQTNNKQQEEKVVFVPAEEIDSIRNVLYKLEQAQQEFRKAVTVNRSEEWGVRSEE